MKKILYIFPIAALALLMSCSKDDQKEVLPDINQDGTTVISADIESLLLGQDNRVWPEGAYIGVFGSKKGTNEKYVMKQAGAGLQRAVFYGPLVAGETLAAYYPWSEGFSGRADSMPANLAAFQDYSEENPVEIFQKYCPTAYACMNGGRMKFFYPFGMLRIRVELYESIKVQDITFSSLDKAVAGTGYIFPDGTLRMSSGAATSLSLNCGEGVDSIIGEEFTDFFLTLVPGTYDNARLIITAQGEDPIVCTLDGITIPRIDASNFTLAAVSVHSTGPEGFTINEQVFD